MNSMNSITQPTLPAIGTPMPGGFFAGVIMRDGQRRAVIVPSKKLGELKGMWHEDELDVPGAKSYNDGMANTQAMAESGSELAKQVLALEIDGQNDFHIPAQDELEICYRAFKPKAEQNWCYARSGINLSAAPATYPYTPEFPVQTILEAFKTGGEEAFEPQAYWSSTQHAGSSDHAWCQSFYNGDQDFISKSAELLVRAVRSQPI